MTLVLLAYGYRRVAWWLWRKQGVMVNTKRVLRVMPRARPADRSTAAAGTTPERVVTRDCGSTESSAAVRHDEGVGGSQRELGLPGLGDRLMQP